LSLVEHPRIARERITVRALARIYCRDHHGLPEGELCADCEGLFSYTMERIIRCPYQEKKPTCANCPIHCYQKTRREQMRAMMRHAGPKMMLRHPILALRHLVDGRVKAPERIRDRPGMDAGDK